MARLNRKGIELSVNFLVMVILAIVLFGLGIIFARNLFNSSTALVSTSQDQLDAAIENMYCTANEIVCINLNSKTLPRGTAKVFGVNVVNAYPDGEFRATIVNTKYIALDNSVTDLRTAPDDQKLQILPEDASFSLGKNKDQRTGFLIRPQTSNPQGKYIVDVDISYTGDLDGDGTIDPVTETNQQYDVTHKIYITVV